MKSNKDRNWLAKRAEQEERHFISVGGLISRVGSLQEVGQAAGSGFEVTQLAFVRLLRLARRERRLSLAQLADQADIDLIEVVNLEMGRTSPPSPRTVYQLASLLRLPSVEPLDRFFRINRMALGGHEVLSKSEGNRRLWHGKTEKSFPLRERSSRSSRRWPSRAQRKVLF